MKLDVLVFAAHPDDMELACSGTVARLKSEGKRVGVVDLTRGQLGTRGNPEIRKREAEAASKVLGIDYRENLGLMDGFFNIDEESLRLLVVQIRKTRPNIVFANAVSDRHPDHGRGAELASRACFLSGLRKVESSDNGESQEAWRPKAVYHYIQDRYRRPDFVVDIERFWEKKIESIMSFSSQFYDPESEEPETPISGKDFMKFLEARARQFGRESGIEMGEGFTVQRPPLVQDLMGLG